MGNNHNSKALIIGAGIGGLSLAIILAKLGFEVTVLDKNRRPGGLMRSYTREGVECEVGIHYLGSLDKGQVLRKFFDYLGVTEAIPVTRMGQNGVIDRYVFDSPATHPKSFDLPEGMDAFAENLHRTFPAAGNAIRQLMASLRKSADQLHGLDLLYATENDFSLLDQFQPLGEILDNLHCPPGLRSILAVPASWIGVPLDDCPAFYHNMALASYLSSSWRLACSGADMAEAVADRLRRLGGKIISDAEVSAIEVNSRKVTGLRLSSGEVLPAGLVIGAVHPKVVLDMLPAGAVKPSYRQRISGLRDTHGIFSVHASIAARAHPELPYNLFKISTDRAGNVPDLKYYQIRRSGRKDVSVLSVLTSGKSELWQPWENTRTGRRGPAYMDSKEEHARRLLREAEDMLGNFQDLRILDVSTPLSMRDWVGSPGGSAYGVQRSASQMLATALLNRTAVQGLYLAGQNVMAPGIIGTITGSFHTAKLILGAAEFRRQVQL